MGVCGSTAPRLQADLKRILYLLLKDSLTKEDVKKVKSLAQTMLAKIKARIRELDRWTDKEETRAIIDTMIRDILYTELPMSYDDSALSKYRQQIFEYVFSAYFSCIYDKDVNSFMEPLLNAATTESPIVNFIGDDYLSVEEMVAYMSELTGIKPEYKYVDELSWPALIIDPEKRKAITGLSAYSWKKGVRETVEYWLPKLKAEQTSADETATVSAAKYTPATRLREISHLPGIVEFLSEKSGQKVPPYALKVGGGMTLQKAGSYLKWTDAQIQNVVNELNERYS